ncbi:hypothetical protein QFZ80_004861 [Paenibacillus sp. V4I7]|nr:hypothetical protein [Paenibacillus sp. V4I7]MDQ0920464.1 hypothetical protein [Paenibacillus sp. V4I5]
MFCLLFWIFRKYMFIIVSAFTRWQSINKPQSAQIKDLTADVGLVDAGKDWIVEHLCQK